MEDRTTLNRQLAQMLKGGVIMDVTTPEQARIAEAAGACAVMALERIPADIRAAGGVAIPVKVGACCSLLEDAAAAAELLGAGAASLEVAAGLEGLPAFELLSKLELSTAPLGDD